MEWQKQAEQSKQSPAEHLQSILALIGGVVGPSIVLISGWDSIPAWGRATILSLISLVTLSYIIVPILRFVKNKIDLTNERRKQKLILQEFTILLQEAHTLYDPHLTCSMRNYVDSIRNAVVQNEPMHSQVSRLSERLQILGNWHWSLLTFSDDGFRQGLPFEKVVRDITRFYRDTANVVRELANIEMPEDGSARAYDDQRRMMKEKYNQHIGSLERVLERIAKTNPELHSGGFHRF